MNRRSLRSGKREKVLAKCNLATGSPDDSAARRLAQNGTLEAEGVAAAGLAASSAEKAYFRHRAPALSEPQAHVRCRELPDATSV